MKLIQPILLAFKLMAWTSHASLTFSMTAYTEDGSMNAVPQILYGQYLILGVFGTYMF